MMLAMACPLFRETLITKLSSSRNDKWYHITLETAYIVQFPTFFLNDLTLNFKTIYLSHYYLSNILQYSIVNENNTMKNTGQTACFKFCYPAYVTKKKPAAISFLTK